MLIYEIAVTILFFAALPFIYVVRAAKGKFMYGWREKFGILNPPEMSDKRIMFHGVSVGEVIALENLIKKAKETFPDYEIIVTTGTKTGQDIAQKKYADVASFITYFPYDVPVFVRKFLRAVKPSMVFIAETELWPAFSYYCKKRNIPLFIINGRISDATYNSYKMFKFFFAGMLKNYTGVYTQSQIDNDKMISIGSNPETTKVMKNLKFDVKRKDCDIEIGQEFGRVIIAGSTHAGEDEIVLEAFSAVKKDFADAKLLLAPRHPQRVPQVTELVEKTGMKFGLRSKNDTFKDNEIIILDTLGELGKMYAICDFAFIGGSFNKTGGHNPLEAVVYDKPAITGPSIHNFRDIYWLLSQTAAGKIVQNGEELTAYMKKLLGDKAFYAKACEDCKTVFAQQQGALDFVIDRIKEEIGV